MRSHTLNDFTFSHGCFKICVFHFSRLETQQNLWHANKCIANEMHKSVVFKFDARHFRQDWKKWLLKGCQGWLECLSIIGVHISSQLFSQNDASRGHPKRFSTCSSRLTYPLYLWAHMTYDSVVRRESIHQCDAGAERNCWTGRNTRWVEEKCQPSRKSGILMRGGQSGVVE